MNNADNFWTREHHRKVWHWGGSEYGEATKCGLTIPGSPLVERYAKDLKEMQDVYIGRFGQELCGECERLRDNHETTQEILAKL